VQGFLAESVVGAAALLDELLGLFAHGHAVSRADALDDGQPLGVHCGNDLLLGGQQHGPDEGEVPARKVGDRREAADAALPPEIHVKGLHGIVQMVAQRHLVAAQFLRCRVQCTAPQLGAQGAGVLLLTVVEHHRADLGTADLIGDIVLGKQLLQYGVIHGPAAELRVQRDGLHRKIKADVLAQFGKADGKGHAVLAAGNAHHHLVAGGDHFIVLHSLAHQAAQTLHCTGTAHDRVTLSTRFTMSLMEASFVRPETYTTSPLG
jgi:hypothetical protein